jgi:hypothetical protein
VDAFDLAADDAHYSSTSRFFDDDGGHMVAVAGQFARDAAGNVIGKGDLGTQMEQVGKNVDACLDAGGAAVKDIAFCGQLRQTAYRIRQICRFTPALLARARQRARSSRYPKRPVPISWCRSRPSPRPRRPGNIGVVVESGG